MLSLQIRRATSVRAENPEVPFAPNVLLGPAGGSSAARRLVDEWQRGDRAVAFADVVHEVHAAATEAWQA
ncbi:hypothetical protein LTR53_003054 [Teratosphaeriaceae sp. CCFEE 6253]|nr:hypothetical protein LTR53_003054 [Teratosphaeriaceae sp. CCFEE 6253]